MPRKKLSPAEEVLRIATDAAPAAMMTIAEAAADGDIGAAYYIINRIMGRPTEEKKEKEHDDYGDVLAALRASVGAQDDEKPDVEGAIAALESSRLYSESGADDSAPEPRQVQNNRRRGTSRKVIQRSDGTDSPAPSGEPILASRPRLQVNKARVPVPDGFLREDWSNRASELSGERVSALLDAVEGGNGDSDHDSEGRSETGG